MCTNLFVLIKLYKHVIFYILKPFRHLYLLLNNLNFPHKKKWKKKSPKINRFFTYKIFCTKMCTNLFVLVKMC